MSEGMTPPPPPGPTQAATTEEPKRIKVFGILHIVFGAAGLLYMGVNVLGLLFKDALEKVSTTGQPPEMIEFQREFNEATYASSWITVVVGAVIALLMLIAGISLVRQKRGSVMLSNLYGLASLAGKVISIVVFVTIISPAVNRLIDEMSAEAPDEVKNMMMMMKGVALGAGVVLPIVMAIYPILTLSMLNRPKVKDYLAQHGK